MSHESRPPAPAAGSARHPTDDDRSYLIPSEQVPADLEARLEGRVEPAVPRSAATVVLARDSGSGPEVLVLRRPHRSSFAANAWVFPGGVVDAGDEDAGRAMLGPGPADWGRRLGLPPGEAVAYAAAALREAWEETGILITNRAVDPARMRDARARLLAGEVSLAEALEGERLRLDASELVYIAHWITPEPEPRRYDARFFLAAVPAGAECDLLGEELVEANWVAPARAVEIYRAGGLRLLPPTVHTLQRLAGHARVADMVDALRGAPVPAILPRMRRDPRGVIIDIPED